MIIDFTNVNGGGGGSGYTLPAATQSTLGGVIVGSGLTITSAGTLSADAQPIGIATTASTGVVKIGDGINVDSAGTISVDGGGVEIVTSLPASGTDGQIVMLVENVPEKILITPTDYSNNTLTLSVTAAGLTNQVTLWNYEWHGQRLYVTLKPDHSVDLHCNYDNQTTNYPVSETSYTYSWPNTGKPTNDLTVVVTSTGFSITSSGSIAKENGVVLNINERQHEAETLYTWSDNQMLTADIDYTISTGNPWCVRFKYSEIPSGTTLVVWKYSFGDDYRHLVYENGEIHSYQSNSADTYTAISYTNCSQYTYTNAGRDGIVYWTDDEVIVYSVGYSTRTSINTDAFYRTGWHKELEHKISNKAFYRDYAFYDGDYQIIVKNNDYKVYDVALKINPNGQYNEPYRVYSRNNSTIGPFFAPTTTGTTGYVCVAGNGWAAPTWVAPETITNGVKFWKGTQDQYDAIGEGNYDASTLYIIIPD